MLPVSLKLVEMIITTDIITETKKEVWFNVSNPEKMPVRRCLSVSITVYVPLQPGAVHLAFTEGGGAYLPAPISLKEARQLEESLSNPTYEESVPFASQSGEMVNIFLDEETKPTFQMTPEGAADFQKKLFEKLSPYYPHLDT